MCLGKSGELVIDSVVHDAVAQDRFVFGNLIVQRTVPLVPIQVNKVQMAFLVLEIELISSKHLVLSRHDVFLEVYDFFLASDKVPLLELASPSVAKVLLINEVFRS